MSSERDLRIRVLLNAMDKASGPLKAIREESRKAGAAIRDTRADIVRLEKAQADLQGFRQLKRGLQDTGVQLDAARKKAAGLARQIDQTEKPTAALSREFASAKREAADLGRAFDRQQRELQETRDRLSAVGVSTRNLVSDERRLASELRQANARLAERKRLYQDLQRSAPRRMEEARVAARVDRDMARAAAGGAAPSGGEGASAVFMGRGGLYAAGAVAGYAALQAGRDSVVEGARFETRMTSIGQKANLTREQAQRLGETLRNISPDLARQSDAMATAADTLAGIGLLGKYDAIKNPEQRFRAIERATADILTASGKAATAYEASEDDLVRSIAAGVRNLKIPEEQAQRMLDIMAAGDNAGAFSMKAMASELPALTGVMEVLGQTGEKALGSLVAGLEIAMSNAADEAEAANNLRNLLLKINSEDVAKNFKEFGIDLGAELKKAKREGRDLLEVIAELTNRATKGDQDKIFRLYGDQQAQLAAIALTGKLNELKTLRQEVMKSDGTVDRQFAERMADTEARFNRLQALWGKLKLEFASGVKPATDGALDLATVGVESLEASLRNRGVGRTLLSGVLPNIGGVQDLLRARTEDRLKAAEAKAILTRMPAAATTPRRAAPLRGPVTAPSRPELWPKEAIPNRLAPLRKQGAEISAEMSRQNSVARQHLFQGVADQRTAATQSLAEAGRLRDGMRQKLGNSAEASSWGRNMMLGLQSGMTATFPSVMGTIAFLGARIKSAFRGDMQIKSPSRVFMGYGRYMSEGLALGIDQGGGKALESMSRLSRGLARPPAINYLSSPSAAPNAATGAGAARTVAPIAITGPITIQITAQPGQDGADLGRQIAAQLASHARAKAARRDSSYEDMD